MVFSLSHKKNINLLYMVKKILVAELEVKTTDLRIQQLDVHSWDIYTFPLALSNFQRMFYNGEGDPKTFGLAPHPTRSSLEGYNQGELQRQGWVSEREKFYKINDQEIEIKQIKMPTNYFQLGGRKRNNSSVKQKVAPEDYGNHKEIPSRADVGDKNNRPHETENAYFIGDPLDIDHGTAAKMSFWADEVIINRMEADLKIPIFMWTESSQHKIREELEFLALGDSKTTYSRTWESIENEIRDEVDCGEIIQLLIVLVIQNAHIGIKNNHLNLHYQCIRPHQRGTIEFKKCPPASDLEKSPNKTLNQNLEPEAPAAPTN